jgi:hypothetical protein
MKKQRPNGRKAKTREQWIADFQKVHGDRYDYHAFTPESNKAKALIACRTHGPFMQSPKDHFSGRGCPKCGQAQRVAPIRISFANFLKRARQLHGDRYEYDRAEFTGMKNKITIVCKKHGPFTQTPDDHTQNRGCPSCAVRDSAPEREIADALRAAGCKVETRDRSVLKDQELDIYLPDHAIAIEYNGLRYHGELFGKGRNYHRGKTQATASEGVRLIHVWEDDYNRDPEGEVRFILSQIQRRRAIGARSCEVTEVAKEDASSFLSKHHQQGPSVATVRLALRYRGEVVAVACFVRRGEAHELVRYASSVAIHGGLAKLCSRLHGRIFTFCDLSRHDGRSYELNGFTRTDEIPPDYKYAKKRQRHHKFGFRRAAIARKLPEFYNENKTEREMMLAAGYDRVWDCGKARYEKYV